jgi:hypothetical protein
MVFSAVEDPSHHLLNKIYGVRHPVDYRLALAETTVKLQPVLEPES